MNESTIGIAPVSPKADEQFISEVEGSKGIATCVTPGRINCAGKGDSFCRLSEFFQQVQPIGGSL